jgi:hypothetical protein
MNIRKRTTALLFLGLAVGICSPAWSADSKSAVATPSATVANPQGNSLLDLLSAVLSDNATRPRERDNRCRATQIYSQHDVVGDPQTCMMNRFTFGTAP